MDVHKGLGSKSSSMLRKREPMIKKLDAQRGLRILLKFTTVEDNWEMGGRRAAEEGER